MFEFANGMLLALFAAAIFDAVTGYLAAPGRGLARVRAAVLDRWQREHFLFGNWGAAWRPRVGLVLFAAALAAYAVSVSFCNSMARTVWDWVQQSLSPVLDWVVFLGFGGKILLGTRYTWRSLGVAGCLYFIGRWTYFNSQNIWWIGIVLAVMAAKGVALRRPLQAFMAAGLAGMAVTVSLFYAGLLPVGQGSDRLGQARGTYGYGHPNTFGGIVLGLVLAYLMLRSKKIRWRDVALVAAVSVFLCVGPDSRSSAMSTALLALALAVYKLWPGLFYRRAMKGVSLAAVVLLVAVSFGLPMLMYRTGPELYDYGPDWIAAIDRFSSNRLALSRIAMERYEVRIAGQFLADDLPLDNSFLYLLYHLGPVVLVLLLVLAVAALWGLLRTRRIPEFLCLAVILAYGLVESQTIHLTTNPAALLLCGAVYALPADRWPGVDDAPPESGLAG